MHEHNPFEIPQDIRTTVDQIMSRNQSMFAGWTMEGEADGAAEAAAAEAAASAAAAQEAADLGDAGKQAIDRMKAERNAERKRAAAAEAELENLRNAGQSEQEKAVAAARKEGESEATKRANARLVQAEAKALAAAAKFRDPTDVIAQLGARLTEVSVDDGEVDQAALKTLVDDLAKSKTYLIETGTPAASAADAGIGVTGNQTTPAPGSKAADLAQIEADLKAAKRR